MNLIKINDEAGRVLEYLSKRELKADEKMAVLKSAASTIECVLQVDALNVMVQKFMSKEKDGV